MKRTDQSKHNQKVINQVSCLIIHKYRISSYRTVCHYLNKNSLTSSIGNKWTERSLYRMLQRIGYRGLWGLSSVTD
jgi:hypothetical protein